METSTRILPGNIAAPDGTELAQCGQCKGFFPFSGPKETTLFGHACSAEPKATRELEPNPAWADRDANVDAPEHTGTGGASRKGEPITDGQIRFLLSLAAERVAVNALGERDPEGRSMAKVLADAGIELDGFVRSMTKKAAKQQIDQLLEQPKVEGQATAPKSTGRINKFAADCKDCGMEVAAGAGLLTNENGKWVVRHPQGECTAAPVKTTQAAKIAPALERGDVHVLDGRYYRVSVGQNSGRLYANVWTGSEWDYAQGAVAKLNADNKITAEQASEFGHATNKCVFCTHDLDIDRSITVGYGPKCASKHGLPW